MARKSDRVPVAVIATLGGKPQVLTQGIDCLMRGQNTVVAHVAAVHLAPAYDVRLAESLRRIAREVSSHYTPTPDFHSIPIRVEPRGDLLQARRAAGRVVASVDDPDAADAIWHTLHHVILAFQERGAQIHMLVTGGPRLLALQALSVASFLFRSNDACWTLSVPADLRAQVERDALLHVPAARRADVSLVKVPLPPLGAMFPFLQAAARLSPKQLAAEGKRRIGIEERDKCRQVIRALPPRVLTTLKVFARGVDRVEDAARELRVTVKTVDAYKTRIYHECRVAWGLPEGQPNHHSFLREHFGDIARDDAWDA